MSSRREVIIRAQNLNKIYKKSRQQITVLKDIDLEIRQGEIVAITGASGSGKSTLLHLLAGLDRSTSGQVMVDGQDLSKLSDKKLSQFRNQTIGFIFQSFYLHPFLTLEKNVEVPAMFLKMKRDQRTSQISQLLERVGLADWAKHFPKELSGGQIQRAAIARALVNSPKIIFADEPTGNLDSTNSDLVIDLLKQIRQDLGTTIVLVTHNPEIVTKADRHIMLKDGVIVSQSDSSSMLDRSNIPGAPMTSQLPPVEIKTPVDKQRRKFSLLTKITRKTINQPTIPTKAEQRQAEFLTQVRHKVAPVEPQPALTVASPQDASLIAPPVRLDARRRQQRTQAANRGFMTEAPQQPNNSQEN